MLQKFHESIKTIYLVCGVFRSVFYFNSVLCCYCATYMHWNLERFLNAQIVATYVYPVKNFGPTSE
jgi:hypothetical protein